MNIVHATQWFSFGGTRATDAAASRDAWAHLVPFFEQALLEESPSTASGSSSFSSPPSCDPSPFAHLISPPVQEIIKEEGLYRFQP